MGRSQDSQWLPTILAELESEDPEIRFEAARAAGLLGSADALPVLLHAARDEDAEVRHTAIGAIGQIGGRGAVRALERLAEDAGEADLELIESAIDDVNALIEPLQPASS
jgi:HEAT repeat protein